MKVLLCLALATVLTCNVRAEEVARSVPLQTSTTNVDGSTTVNLMDSNNRPLKSSRYSPKGELRETTVLHRDRSDMIMESITVGANGKEKSKDTFSYDSLGKLVQTKRTKADGKVWVRQEVYDESRRHSGTKVLNPEGHEVSADKWE